MCFFQAVTYFRSPIALPQAARFLFTLLLSAGELLNTGVSVNPFKSAVACVATLAITGCNYDQVQPSWFGTAADFAAKKQDRHACLQVLLMTNSSLQNLEWDLGFQHLTFPCS